MLCSTGTKLPLLAGEIAGILPTSLATCCATHRAYCSLCSDCFSVAQTPDDMSKLSDEVTHDEAFQHSIPMLMHRHAGVKIISC